MDFNRSKTLLWIVLVILIIGAFSSTIQGDFVWDDHAVITENSQMKESVLALLHTPFAASQSRGYWRPLSALTLWCDYQLGGGSPLPFRIFNILAHLVVALLFALLLNKLVPNETFIVWTSCLLFALHPSHGESVGWIVGRTNVLAGLFSLATVGLGVRYIESGRRVFLGGAVTTFLLGMFSKESAVVSLALVLLIAWVRSASQESTSAEFGSEESGAEESASKGSGTDESATEPSASAKLTENYWFRHSFVWALTALFALILWSGARYCVLGSLSRDLSDVPFAQTSIFQRIPLAIAVLGLYLQLAFVPYMLLPVYPGTVLPASWSPVDPTYLGLMTIVVVAILVSLFSWKRERLIGHERLIGAGLCWFFVSLVPVSQLFLVLNFPIAARCLYLPLMGWALGTACLLKLIPIPKLRIGIVVLVVLFFIVALQENCLMWSNDVTLWQSCIKRRQGSASLRVLVEMGLAYSKSGQPKLALSWYERAEAINRTKFNLQVKMARAQMQMGHVKRAAKRLRLHLKENPDDQLARDNLQFLLSIVGHKGMSVSREH